MDTRALPALNSRDPFERALALLEPKQQRFVREYLKDRNGKQAAIRAGYSAKTAVVQASQLLRKLNVADAVHEGELKAQDDDRVYIQRLRRENRRIALSDIRDLFDENGNILPMNEWPPDAAACVASIELVMRNTAAGAGVVRVLKLKLWKKTDAIKLDYESYGLSEPQIDAGPDVPAFVFLDGGKVSIT